MPQCSVSVININHQVTDRHTDTHKDTYTDTDTGHRRSHELGKQKRHREAGGTFASARGAVAEREAGSARADENICAAPCRCGRWRGRR